MLVYLNIFGVVLNNDGRMYVYWDNYKQFWMHHFLFVNGRLIDHSLHQHKLFSELK